MGCAFLTNFEVVNCGVRKQDLDNRDVWHDPQQNGYWIRYPSPTSTLLTLKGCELFLVKSVLDLDTKDPA
jgi:hypothetical protein